MTRDEFFEAWGPVAEDYPTAREGAANVTGFSRDLDALLAAACAEALEEAARVSSPRRVGIAHRCDCADVIRALVNP